MSATDYQNLESNLNKLGDLQNEQLHVDPVTKLQNQIYQDLLALRTSLGQSLEVIISPPNQEDSNDEETNKILSEAKAENKKLKYRIQILADTIDTIESKISKQ
eukprot:403331671